MIAILATITVVAYKGISTRAADAAMTAEIGQLTKQLEAIKVEQGEYPWAIPNFSSELIAQHNNTSSTAPFLRSSGTVTVQQASTYNPPQGCNSSTAFLRDNENAASLSGTGLFALKRQ